MGRRAHRVLQDRQVSQVRADDLGKEVERVQTGAVVRSESSEERETEASMAYQVSLETKDITGNGESRVFTVLLESQEKGALRVQTGREDNQAMRVPEV